jgi:hypothetical protein
MGLAISRYQPLFDGTYMHIQRGAFPAQIDCGIDRAAAETGKSETGDTAG